MFDVDFLVLLSKKSKTKPKSSHRVSEMATVPCAMIERLDRLEAKMDRLEARLSLLEESSSECKQ